LLHEICYEEETEQGRARLKIITMVIVNFPSEIMEIAENLDDDLLGFMPNFPVVRKYVCEMFEFCMRFEFLSIKSPMKWLSFPREAKVKCRITLFIYI
jgi:hypothetical protein